MIGAVRWAWIGAAATLAAGCAVGPDFKRPAAPISTHYTDQPLPAATVATDSPGGAAQRFLSNQSLDAQWWTRFHSPRLDALVEQALKNSPSVASAQAALREAQANLAAQRGVLFPSLDLGASATRQKIDTSSFGNPGGGSAIYNLYNASVQFSYGLDLWGGTRRAVEASAATAEAQAFIAEGTYQTLIANLITTAVQEALQNTLAVGQVGVIEDQSGQLEIAEARFADGAASRNDLLNVQAATATEQSILPSYRLAALQAHHLLATYVGKLPAEYTEAPFGFDDFQVPVDLPISVPSTLVARRPDVRAAEARLHAASAEIGVATANLLPSITLSASVGTLASSVGKLFSNQLFSLGGAIAQPLFHGGTLTAERRAAIDAYDQAAADYRQTVLTAFREVADTLRALQADAERLSAQRAADQAATATVEQTRRQVAIGSSAKADLLAAQENYKKVHAGYLNALAQRLQDTAALFLALGGGWQGEPGVVPEATAAAQP